jgi:toxin ParE1/3/4
MRPIIHHPEAEAELIEAARFYNRRRPGLGDEFAAAVDAAVAVIAERPARFRVLEDDIRRCLLKRFPYSILFREAAGAIQILAFKHHARHPDYWKHRTAS